MDPDNDLAVIKIDVPAEKIKPLPLGDSRKLQVGQKVLAIGNPFGLGLTLTTGIISQLGRTIQDSVAGSFPIANIIQTSAEINIEYENPDGSTAFPNFIHFSSLFHTFKTLLRRVNLVDRCRHLELFHAFPCSFCNCPVIFEDTQIAAKIYDYCSLFLVYHLYFI
jgi:hypothetical protein